MTSMPEKLFPSMLSRNLHYPVLIARKTTANCKTSHTDLKKICVNLRNLWIEKICVNLRNLWMEKICINLRHLRIKTCLDCTQDNRKLQN